MKKQLINFVVTSIIAIILSQFSPWWSVMIAGFVSAFLFSLDKADVFFIPFLAIFCFWSVYAFILSSSNDFVLAKKIAVLLPLGGNPYLLVLITGVVGGLASGLAAVFGKQLRTLIRK